MAETTTPDCLNCRWWREQTGSAHVLCPTRMDFSFGWGPTPCDLFAPEFLCEIMPRDGVNAFLAWGGSKDSGMPSDDEIMEWFDAHPEYKTEAFNAARKKYDAQQAAQETD